MTNILLVEDNPMDVRLLRYSLEYESGWEIDIRVAEDGEEAIECILSPLRVRPDLVILDLNLPGRDGTEVLKVIRTESSTPDLPVIVFSSSPEDLMRKKVGEAHLTADCYVTKPVGLEVFMGLGQHFRRCYEKAVERGARKDSPVSY